MSQTPPSAPNPYDTAKAQSGANLDAIRESAKLNALNQYGPYGSTTFQRDKNGLPISQTVKLGNNEQQFYDMSSAIKNALAGKASQYLSYLPDSQFTGPDQGAGDAVAKALYDRKLGMIQPQLDQAANQEKVSLSERGIPIGSEVYTGEMDRQDKARADALAGISQDATLAGGQEYDRQLQNMLTLRAQPFNEISAFLQGGPSMQSPQFQQQPAYNMQAPDISGLIQNNYQNQLNSYNSNQSSLANGLFGLGSAGLSFLSDRRAKTDITRIGKTDGGLPIYRFRYKTGGAMQIGVMAQDLETLKPSAVFVRPDGMKLVDYAQVA